MSRDFINLSCWKKFNSAETFNSSEVQPGRWQVLEREYRQSTESAGHVPAGRKALQKKRYRWQLTLPRDLLPSTPLDTYSVCPVSAPAAKPPPRPAAWDKHQWIYGTNP